MKPVEGASLIVWVNDAGEVIEAKNADKRTGDPVGGDIKYGPEELKANKKFVGGAFKNKIRYPNSCCWKLTPSGWICGPC
jgi:hypothetical protein